MITQDMSMLKHKLRIGSLCFHREAAEESKKNSSRVAPCRGRSKDDRGQCSAYLFLEDQTHDPSET
jgi:ferredoxin-thioredoxin reductase catalytic subunit